MENIEHKYHAEVKSKDCLVRINVFAEDLPSLFKDLDVIYDYIGYEESPSSNHVIASAAKQSPGNGNGHIPQPPCLHCGSVGTVEIVRWTDRNNGQPRQAPKCQACSKWIR